MSVRRIRVAATLFGVGLAAQVSTAQPAATTPAPAAKPPAIKATVVPAAAPSAVPAAAPSGPVGKVEIKETIFDAGEVERGKDITHAFQLKNVGLGDLNIEAKPG